MTVEPDIMPPKSRSRRTSLSGNTLSVSLKILGFSSWKDLEPGRYEEFVFILRSLKILRHYYLLIMLYFKEEKDNHFNF